MDPNATLQTFFWNSTASRRFLRATTFWPMGAAILVLVAAGDEAIPAAAFLRFFQNHGLLDITHRPQWYVVPGGSREYIRAMLDKLGDRLNLHLNSPVQRVSRHEHGLRSSLKTAAIPSIG